MFSSLCLASSFSVALFSASSFFVSLILEFSFLILATLRILHSLSSESELLASLWMFLAVSAFFFWQSLEVAKCPVFLQALHALPQAMQFSPPLHFQMLHFSQVFFLTWLLPSVLSFFP